MEILYFILLLVGVLCFLGAALGRGVTAGSGTGRGARAGVGALALLPLGLFFVLLPALIQSARVAF